MGSKPKYLLETELILRLKEAGFQWRGKQGIFYRFRKGNRNWGVRLTENVDLIINTLTSY